jgi:hypothetical protein
MGNEGGPIVCNMGQQGPQLTPSTFSSAAGKWGMKVVPESSIRGGFSEYHPFGLVSCCFIIFCPQQQVM